MVKELIKEINYCLNTNCCMAALALALTLPDICGKALYPQSKPSERYVKWYDEHISKCESADENTLKVTGDLIYSLRNSIIHEGNPNVNHNKFDVSYFELLYNTNDFNQIVSFIGEETFAEDEDGNKILVERKITINLKILCLKICTYAEKCYEMDKDKFSFFNYNLVDADYKTRKHFE